MVLGRSGSDHPPGLEFEIFPFFLVNRLVQTVRRLCDFVPAERPRCCSGVAIGWLVDRAVPAVVERRLGFVVVPADDDRRLGFPAQDFRSLRGIRVLCIALDFGHPQSSLRFRFYHPKFEFEAGVYLLEFLQ